MSLLNLSSSLSSVLSNNTKVIALENTLQQGLQNVKDLLYEFEQLHIESDNYKTQFKNLKDKCDSNSCSSAEALKKIIVAKDHIIQLAASTLTRLNETKDLKILDEVFKILFGETAPIVLHQEKAMSMDKMPSPIKIKKETTEKELSVDKMPLPIRIKKETPEKELSVVKMPLPIRVKKEIPEKELSVVKMPTPLRIKKESYSTDEELSFKEESVSEIEGTPTSGRSSPIIQMKKLKSSLKSDITSTNLRHKNKNMKGKKKCPNTWPTPDSKTRKLTYSTPLRGQQNGRWQARLKVVKVPEPRTLIDITCSPEFGGGCRKVDNGSVQPLVKKESIENDDTILPSPTSGPTNFSIFNNKESPMKFKKPQLSLKTKTENGYKTKKLDQKSKIGVKLEPNSENQLIKNIKVDDSATFNQEDSINILNPKRLPNNMFRSPVKQERHTDETYCDTESSISLLQHVNYLEDIHRGKESSPSKQPLAENINITNVPDENELQQSMSLLQREPNHSKVNKPAVDNVKRKIPELAELAYKEPAVRKKADKRLLPGWSCDKCIEFFGELYKDDPEMLAKKINECSHHRGVNNPTDRPKTPPGYWNPRWEVPDDTEEFNRRNNV